MALFFSKRLLRFAIVATLVVVSLMALSRNSSGVSQLQSYIPSGTDSIGASSSATSSSVAETATGERELTDKEIEDLVEQANAAHDRIQSEAGNEKTNAWDYVRSKSSYKIGERPKACFVALVRNSELYDMISSMRYVEQKFNSKYKYPWVFLNDEPFSDEFKQAIISEVSGEVKFGLIPESHWSYPQWIDPDRAAQTRVDMADIIYGDSESYRHMCRFQSGFFWRNGLLDEYDWYWRVEPGTKLYCDIDYDVFQWMQDNEKAYGFTISIHEFEDTIKTLWETTTNFTKKYPEFLDKKNLLQFISDDKGKTYNLCHFWSNFEIANLNFWRSPAYKKYFNYLDQSGGFFYERWGDAPVHSIAASLFLPRDKIHYFPNIGYHHIPYDNCPIDDSIFTKYNCECDQDNDFTFQDYSCGVKYYDVQGLEKPKGWKSHTG